MKLLLILITILTISSFVYAEEYVTIPKSKLIEWQNHIKLLQETIDELEQELTLKDIEIHNFSLQFEQYRIQLKKQKGVYLGGDIGYPFLTINGLILYKFDNYGVYLHGGYSGRFHIDLGVIGKL